MCHKWARTESQRGFTLTELMIVVAIVGVLSLVAYPSFIDSVRKSRRADAMAGLGRLQQLQERYRGTQPAYAAAVASMPTASSSSNEGHYQLAITAANASGYTMTATAAASSPQFAATSCRALTVTMANGSPTTSSTDAAGVVDTVNANRCWVK